MKLPDTRSLSPDTLELLRKIAVRAVLDLGQTNKETAQLLGLSENTVGQWVSAYRNQGEEALESQTQGRPIGSGRSLEIEQEEAIQQILCTSTPQDHQIALATWTREAVAQLIEQRYHISLTLQGVGKYLGRWGFTPQKPARHAREQDPDEVEEFLEETLPETLEQAEEEGGEVHFTDETGVKATDQIGTSYAPRGETPIQEVPEIRIGQNIISTVSEQGELHYWLFGSTMTGEKFRDYLQDLVNESSGKIFLIADRHPTHTASIVEDWLQEHQSEIEIRWLPRYSPEMNPVEFLNNDLKQNLKNEPMPEDTPGLLESLRRILDYIGSIPERVMSYYRTAQIDLESSS